MNETSLGTPNELFNLVSILYHQLKQAETCLRYARDAQEAGDQELTEFFHAVIEQSQSLSDRAKALFSQRMESLVQRKSDDEARVEESSKESFPASDAPAY